MEFSLSWDISILACAIVMIGAVLQGSLGIGLGFVAVPLLVLLNPVFIPGPLLLSALLLTLLISFREHRSIEFSGIQWAIAGRTMGTILGASLLSVIPEKKLSLLFGIIVITAVIISLSGFRLALSSKNLFGTGTLSGFMGTTSAIGGVAMALIYQDFEGPRLRGTLSGIFVIGTAISIISLICIGHFGVLELQMAIILLPGILMGYVISHWTAKVLDKGYIRPMVLLIASLSGIIILIKYIY
jgi:uncharacterized membrane protein YfcA